MEQTCKNCGNGVPGKFCTNCGQKADTHDLTFTHIFHEVIHAFTHADKSFFAFLKSVTLNPGKVGYEYIIEGKRKRYYNPFAFFLLITAISAFVESGLLNLREQLFHDNNEYARMFNAYNKLMLLVIVPAIGFVIFTLYHRKSHRRFSEYIVFAMMLLSMKAVIDIIINAINFLLSRFFHIYRGLDQFIFYPLLIATLVALAVYRFHRYSFERTIIKHILAGLLFCLVIAFIDMFIVWAFMRHFNGLGVFNIYGLRISG